MFALIERAALVLGAVAATSGHSAEQRWKPEQNVEIIIPSGPGTGSDASGRWIQQLLTGKKLIDTPATVVNKPGGAATIALVYMNQHPGNGHYFTVITPALLSGYITGSTRIKHTDITPLAQIGRESIVFVVRADSPLKTAKDLLDRLKADPGSVSIAFANALGNQNHIAAAKVVKAVGANAKSMRVVVFNGSGEALTALLGGHVDVVTISASPVLQHLKTGKLSIVAVAAEQRLGGALSAVPTWRELGVASVWSIWRGLVGPRGMSDDQVRYWDEVFGKLVQLPEWKQDMDAKMVENTYLNARDTKKLMDAEYSELTTVLTELGLAK